MIHQSSIGAHESRRAIGDSREYGSSTPGSAGLIMGIILVLLFSFVGAFVVMPKVFLNTWNLFGAAEFAQATDAQDRVALLAVVVGSAAIFTQLAGSVFLAATLYTTFRSMRQTQSSLMISQMQVDIAEATNRGERYSRAVDQLGFLNNRGQISRKVRLGSILSLGMIAREDAHYSRAIMYLLSAYVRENATPTSAEYPEPREHTDIDLVGVLHVIASRSPEQGMWSGSTRISLAGSWLPGIELRDGNFSNVDFGGTWLKGCDFSNGDFDGASFDNAYLDGVNLSGARNLRMSALQHAFMNQETILPEGVDRDGVMFAPSEKPYIPHSAMT